MEFKSKSDLKELLRLIKPIGYGSTATVYYYPRSKKVLKISNSFFHSLEMGILPTSYDISKFEGIENDTYLLPHELVKVGDKTAGIIYPYVEGTHLLRINSQELNLIEFEDKIEKARQDTLDLSKNGILICDMPYNTMLTSNGIKVIDTEDYSKPDEYPESIEEKNIKALNITIKDFIFTGFYKDFVASHGTLYEMYKDDKINITEFLKEFRKYLSTYYGKNIESLSEINEVQNKLLEKKKNTGMY